MTHTTQRAAGSSAPSRWPPAGKAYSFVDHSGSSYRASIFCFTETFLRLGLNVTLRADTKIASWYNLGFPGVPGHGVQEMHWRSGFSGKNAEPFCLGLRSSS